VDYLARLDVPRADDPLERVAGGGRSRQIAGETAALDKKV
jgi:hypothetical protein